HLPPGVLESPPDSAPSPDFRYLPACLKMTERLRALALAARAQGKPGPAFDHLAQILALSRTLRNKAPLASYLAGVRIEASALEGLDQWLAGGKPPADVLRRVLDELNRHAAETPTALDCLETECYRAGGVLNNPAGWSFSTNARGSGPGTVPGLA